MELITLFIAIFSALLWINMTCVDFVNAKLNPYGNGTEEEKQQELTKSKMKLYCLLITSIAWAAYITCF